MSLFSAGPSRVLRSVSRQCSKLTVGMRRSFRSNSLRFEISVMFSLLTGVILAIVCAGLYVTMSQTLYTELDNNLILKAQGISQALRSHLDVYGQDSQQLKKAIKATIIKQDASTKWWMFGFQRRWQGLLKDLNLKEEYVNFASYFGNSLYRSPNMTPELTEKFNEVIPPARIRSPYFKNIVLNNQKLRDINSPFNYKGEFDFLIQVGVYPKPITLLLQSWIYSILGAIPVIVILTFFIGQLISMRIIRPIGKLTLTARKITTEDLSERIETESFYREMNALISEFNNMINRLENSFSHIEEFSAQVAHELKTPLTIIKGEAELALLKERPKEEYQKALQINLEECERMLKIVEDLLLLARMDYQTDVFDLRRIDLVKFLRELVDHAAVLAREKNLLLDFETGAKAIHIKADAVHLKRLFLNLIDNAIKFSPENATITVKAQQKGRFASISVRDRGAGIPMEKIHRIFDRFYRIDPRVKGSGLGLHIAMMIARSHKGDIAVSSEPGQGTTFTVTLLTV
jgi:heavy metal sensor kinase